MSAALYTIQVHDGTAWCLHTGHVTRAEARGYLMAILDGPTPRLAYRVVRVSDGKVVDGLAAVDTVDVGQSAGSPHAEQLLGAAMRVLVQAASARPVDPETVYLRWQEVSNVATSGTAKWALHALGTKSGVA